jgi:hypothetical protein
VDFMNSLKTWQTINPSPDEMHAASAAFGELPNSEALPRLIMVRRAVAAGFYTDNLRQLSPTDQPSHWTIDPNGWVCD